MAVWASPTEDAVLVLEKWTSFHWGRDCLIWIVHYSDEVVGPWVEAEAAKANFNESQKNEYRRAFVSELRMDESEPFLVSIYSFGDFPLELKPFGEMVSLINSDGNKFKPTSYERVFDEPVSGMVQGLVFFPKQRDKNFSLALRGTGVFDERVFSFGDRDSDIYDIAPVVASDTQREDLVVIDMPPAPPPPPPKKKEVEKETPPPVVVQEQPKEEPVAASADQNVEKQPAADKNLYISREKAVQNFINSWIANDALSMYDMLSEETRKMYSAESFEKEIKKISDFRRGLLRGYKMDWMGEERVKIITTKRLLIMRTLISRTLGIVRTGQEWRIVW